MSQAFKDRYDGFEVLFREANRETEFFGKIRMRGLFSKLVFKVGV